MLRNIYTKLFFIATIFIVALLISLPKIPVKTNKLGINIDSHIGGYRFELFGGKIKVDLSELKKGLDLNGGVKVVLEADMSGIDEGDRDGALESAKEVITRRVDLLGVAEPSITTSKIGEEYRIIVEIPGVVDVSEAIDLIGRTAQLKFRKLAEGTEWDETKIEEYFTDVSFWEDTNVSGSDLAGVDVVFPDGNSAVSSSPQIRLRFTNEGREKFSNLAKLNINKPIGIFLDDMEFPLSMPIVGSDLAEGIVNDPVISGNFDVETAKALSVQIRAGALPVPVKVIEQRTIGATLGGESISKSVFAGGLGIILVMIFMIVMYGRLGLFADIALVIYTLIVISVFKIVPVVLTLPGMAGFMLSVGMAADANILIFERIREEFFWGRPRGLAVKYGFDRAWTSIRDSNITSLITAGILFYFGTGSVRGFALTLAIGILVSLFTSVFVTKVLVSTFNVREKKT